MFKLCRKTALSLYFFFFYKKYFILQQHLFSFKKVLKLVYNETCQKTEQCNDKQKTICYNSSGTFKCECPAYTYFAVESNTCVNKTTIYEKCKSNKMCLTTFGPECDLKEICMYLSTIPFFCSM
jgi:hypothetical protein